MQLQAQGLVLSVWDLRGCWGLDFSKGLGTGVVKTPHRGTLSSLCYGRACSSCLYRALSEPASRPNYGCLWGFCAGLHMSCTRSEHGLFSRGPVRFYVAVEIYTLDPKPENSRLRAAGQHIRIAATTNMSVRSPGHNNMSQET